MEFLQGMVMTKIRFSSQLLLTEDILWTTSTIVLKQVSVNDKGYPFFWKKLCPIRTKFETTRSQSINHIKFAIYCWQKTLKMSVHTTKSGLPINSCYKFLFFLRYVYGKKWKLSIFFLFKVKRHVWMTSFEIIIEFWQVFSQFG